jgi:sec-independent protein translocase protein TatB
MGKARKMAAEFQGQFQEAMREAEMADLKKSFDEVKEAATGFTGGNVMTSLQKDVSDALNIGDIDKPAVSADAATAAVPEVSVSADAPVPVPASEPEPLAITPEVQPQPVVPPAAEAEHTRDAKAS